MSYESYLRWKTTPIVGEPFLSVIIPAYNEEDRIIPTIGAIAFYISSLGFDWELLIADDGSRDQTVNLVEDLGLVNLRVLKAPRNGGKGSAVRRGVLAAKGRYVLWNDADNSTPIEQVGKLLSKLDLEEYDLAIGSRAIAGAAEANRTVLRRFLSGGLRWISRYVFQIGVRDTQCGFKMYRREVGQQLHQMQTIMGFSFDFEILYLAAKYGFRIAEVPVEWIDSPGSKVNTRKEVQRFMRDLIKIKLNDLRGVYVRV